MIKAAGIVRSSPLIGPKIPVHGLLVDIQTGRLEWLVNGYEFSPSIAGRWNEVMRSAGETVDALRALSDFKIGELKFPETKIGEIVSDVEDWAAGKLKQAEIGSAPPPAPPVPPVPPKLPMPPPLRPRLSMRKKP